MNINRMKAVRDHVVANKNFKFSRALHPCGSAGCIMGSAWVLMLENMSLIDPDQEWNYGSVIPEHYKTKIADWLDITMAEFLAIYYGDFLTNSNLGIKEECVAYLQRCVRAGRVIMSDK
jgi:hypothetical protein